ncbi:MAG: undecaprenyl-phosphate glucose phosphotransferase, partial [Lachnospiraceae bacterium]|nr:undecaprenyl-phosphate glucose phosphotransferase [Lachnospiraceae bacterium]
MSDDSGRHLLSVKGNRMIKDNQVYLNRLHIVMDGTLVALSYALAWFLKFMTPLATTTPGLTAYPARTYFAALYFIIPMYLVLYSTFHLYSSRRVTRIRNEFFEIIRANTIGVIGCIVVFFLTEMNDFSKMFLAFFYVINILLTCAAHYFFRWVMYRVRRSGKNLKHVLCIGYSRAAEAYIDRILANGQWGYVVHGILDDHVPRGTTYRGVRVLGSIANLKYILPENKLDEIAITLSLNDYQMLEKIVAECEKSGV